MDQWFRIFYRFDSHIEICGVFIRRYRYFAVFNEIHFFSLTRYEFLFLDLVLLFDGKGFLADLFECNLNLEFGIEK